MECDSNNGKNGYQKNTEKKIQNENIQKSSTNVNEK